MFMQAGFALVETGLTRAKNVAHTMGMNFLVYSIGILGFWVLGFGLQMGGVGALSTFGNDATLSGEFAIHIAGKEFGLQRLTDLVCGAAPDDADAIVKRCVDDVTSFAPGRLRDDVTIALLCRGPREPNA